MSSSFTGAMEAVVFAVMQGFLLLMIGSAYTRRDEVLWLLSGLMAAVMAMISAGVEPLLLSFNVGLIFVGVTWSFVEAYRNYGSPLLIFKQLKEKRKSGVLGVFKKGE